jgi:GTP-binding protein
LDITYTPARDIIEDFLMIQKEMAEFAPPLAKKPCLVVINKMDLHHPGHRDLAALRQALLEKGVSALPISALTGEGLEALKWRILQEWEAANGLAA